jgi:hypothetical protein
MKVSSLRSNGDAVSQKQKNAISTREVLDGHTFRGPSQAMERERGLERHLDWYNEILRNTSPSCSRSYARGQGRKEFLLEQIVQRQRKTEEINQSHGLDFE